MTGLARSGDRASGVRLSDGTTIPAGAVLVAAGPWSPALLDPTGRWQPIRANWAVVVEVGLADPPGHVLEEAEMDEVLGDIAGGGPAVAEAGIARRRDDPATPRTLRDADGSDGRPEFSLVTAAGRSSLGSTFLDREPDGAALGRAARRPRPAVRPGARAGAGRPEPCLRPAAGRRRPPAPRAGRRPAGGVPGRRNMARGASRPDRDRPASSSTRSSAAARPSRPSSTSPGSARSGERSAGREPPPPAASATIRGPIARGRR